jgi:hypothetical protein
MTLVAARKSGDRILMVSDTKLTRSDGTIRSGSGDQRIHDYVPGCLKSLVLSLKLSVGYAGISAKAIRTIRALTHKIDCSLDLAGALEFLQLASRDGTVDFIVVSHIDGPQILKVRDGSVSGDQDFHWIGDQEVCSLFLASIEEQREQHRRTIVHPDDRAYFDEFHEESCFRGGWSSLLLKSPSLTQSVGGIPIDVLCSPHGHCYQGGGGAFNANAIQITANGQWFGPDGQKVPPLYGQYSYSLVGSALRGVPVIGVWLQETCTGYLYDPIESDLPERMSPTTIEALQEQVLRRSKLLGGIQID